MKAFMIDLNLKLQLYQAIPWGPDELPKQDPKKHINMLHDGLFGIEFEKRFLQNLIFFFFCLELICFWCF